LERLFTNEGFTESVSINNAVEDYKRENDTIASFVFDCCEFGDEFETERTQIYDAYVTYCQKEGFEAESRISCYNRIRSNPQVGEKRERKGMRHFKGINIKQEFHNPPGGR